MAQKTVLFWNWVLIILSKLQLTYSFSKSCSVIFWRKGSLASNLLSITANFWIAPASLWYLYEVAVMKRSINFRLSVVERQKGVCIRTSRSLLFAGPCSVSRWYFREPNSPSCILRNLLSWGASVHDAWVVSPWRGDGLEWKSNGTTENFSYGRKWFNWEMKKQSGNWKSI